MPQSPPKQVKTFKMNVTKPVLRGRMNKVGLREISD